MKIPGNLDEYFCCNYKIEKKMYPLKGKNITKDN